MRTQHTHYARQDDLLDSTEFTLTHGQTGDGEAALQRELDRRNSDCAKKQTDWLKHDTRMIQGAIDGRGIVEERAAKYGIPALSDREILTLHCDSDETANALLTTAGSVAALRRWSPDEYMSVPGMTQKRALRMATVFALHERSHEDDSPVFDTCEAVARHFRPIADNLSVEKFWVMCLDRKNRLMRRVEISSGTATNCLCHPREVFRTAIHVSATAIIAVHNHPSGDPAPSRADIQVTRQLREAAKIIGIDLIDHIIIGQQSKDPNRLGYYSFNDAGLI